MALQPGDTLHNGQFEILALLGRGGFGFVYRARDTYLDEDVAIKELLPGLIGDDLLFKRFLAEAKATIRLRHEGIVGTRQVFPDRGNAYIVMDYLPGGSLEDRLRQGPFSVEEGIRIAAQVCDALDYAHRRGLVHCDLKPANILFAADGSARLADFGIAYTSDQALTRSWHTPAGFVAGTLPYMSPEQAAGTRDDPRIDLYALGAVLYRMLTGRTYLDFDTSDTPLAQSENIQRIYRQAPQPPSDHRSGIPTWLDRAVLKALAKDPAARHATARAFQAALRGPDQAALAATSPPPPTAPPASASPSPAPRPAPEPRRTRAPLPRWLWPAAGAGLLVVILGIVLAALPWGRNPETPTPTATDRAVSFATATLAPTHTPHLIATRTSTPTITPTPRPTATQTPTITPSPTPTPTPSSTPPGDGGRIAFYSSRDGNDEIYVMNADGSGLTRLTNNSARDWSPTWSPDGDRIAFVSDRDGNVEIYVMNADGSGQTRLTDNPTGDYSPAWSPDGDRIAFYSDPDGDFEVYVMNADGSDVTRLTDNLVLDGSPAWSPDGRSIAFVSESGDSPRDIYVMNADGSSQTRLTDHVYNDLQPTWSPDGRSIAFGSDRLRQFDIYVMNADGSDITRLTDNPASDEYPAWSPDGRLIAFRSDRDGNYEIYVMNADGSGLTRLTDNPAKDSGPAWSP